MTATTKVWTRQQYDAAVAAGIFAGEHVELIDGEIIEMAPMDAAHATAVTLVQQSLTAMVDPTKYIIRTQQPLGVAEHDEPEPDVAVVEGKARDFTEEHPATAAVVFEVANSSLAYDLTTKVTKYASCSVDRYFVVDLMNRRVIDFSGPDGAGYLRQTNHDANSNFELFERNIAVNDLLP